MQRWGGERSIRDLWHEGWIGGRVKRLEKGKNPDSWTSKIKSQKHCLIAEHSTREVSTDEVGSKKDRYIKTVPNLMMVWLRIFRLYNTMKTYTSYSQWKPDFEFCTLIFSQTSNMQEDTALTMLGSGSEPQLPVSHVIPKVNNWYSTVYSLY